MRLCPSGKRTQVELTRPARNGQCEKRWCVATEIFPDVGTNHLYLQERHLIFGQLQTEASEDGESGLRLLTQTAEFFIFTLVQQSSIGRNGEARSKSLERRVTAKLGESMWGKTARSTKAVCDSLARFLRFRGSSRISARVKLNAIFSWHRYARLSSRVLRRSIVGKHYANECMKPSGSVVVLLHTSKYHFWFLL